KCHRQRQGNNTHRDACKEITEKICRSITLPQIHQLGMEMKRTFHRGSFTKQDSRLSSESLHGEAEHSEFNIFLPGCLVTLQEWVRLHVKPCYNRRDGC